MLHNQKNGMQIFPLNFNFLYSDILSIIAVHQNDSAHSGGQD